MTRLILYLLCLLPWAATWVPAESVENTIADLLEQLTSTDTGSFFNSNGSDFNIFINLLRVANLQNTLSEETGTKFTVFAPTDDAFMRTAHDFGLGVTDEREASEKFFLFLTLHYENPIQAVSAFLAYHIIPEKLLFPSADSQTSQQSRTFDLILQSHGLSRNGQSLTDQNPYMPNAKVFDFNIEASNGVLHVIDRLLLPDENLLPDEFATPETAESSENPSPEVDIENESDGPLRPKISIAPSIRPLLPDSSSEASSSEAYAEYVDESPAPFGFGGDHDASPETSGEGLDTDTSSAGDFGETESGVPQTPETSQKLEGGESESPEFSDEGEKAYSAVPEVTSPIEPTTVVPPSSGPSRSPDYSPSPSGLNDPIESQLPTVDDSEQQNPSQAPESSYNAIVDPSSEEASEYSSPGGSSEESSANEEYAEGSAEVTSIIPISEPSQEDNSTSSNETEETTGQPEQSSGINFDGDDPDDSYASPQEYPTVTPSLLVDDVPQPSVEMSLGPSVSYSVEPTSYKISPSLRARSPSPSRQPLLSPSGFLPASPLASAQLSLGPGSSYSVEPTFFEVSPSEAEEPLPSQQPMPTVTYSVPGLSYSAQPTLFEISRSPEAESPPPSRQPVFTVRYSVPVSPQASAKLSLAPLPSYSADPTYFGVSSPPGTTSQNPSPILSPSHSVFVQPQVSIELPHGSSPSLAVEPTHYGASSSPAVRSPLPSEPPVLSPSHSGPLSPQVSIGLPHGPSPSLPVESINFDNSPSPIATAVSSPLPSRQSALIPSYSAFVPPQASVELPTGHLSSSSPEPTRIDVSPLPEVTSSLPSRQPVLTPSSSVQVSGQLSLLPSQSPSILPSPGYTSPLISRQPGSTPSHQFPETPQVSVGLSFRPSPTQASRPTASVASTFPEVSGSSEQPAVTPAHPSSLPPHTSNKATSSPSQSSSSLPTYTIVSPLTPLDTLPGEGIDASYAPAWTEEILPFPQSSLSPTATTTGTVTFGQSSFEPTDYPSQPTLHPTHYNNTLTLPPTPSVNDPIPEKSTSVAPVAGSLSPAPTAAIQPSSLLEPSAGFGSGQSAEPSKLWSPSYSFEPADQSPLSDLDESPGLQASRSPVSAPTTLPSTDSPSESTELFDPVSATVQPTRTPVPSTILSTPLVSYVPSPTASGPTLSVRPSWTPSGEDDIPSESTAPVPSRTSGGEHGDMGDSNVPEVSSAPSWSPHVSSLPHEGQNKTIEGFWVCFPASAVVHLEDGDMRAIHKLTAGDHVKASESLSSMIYFFSHRRGAVLTDFVRIESDWNHTITMSEGHYLYANGRLKAAGDVQIGDFLRTLDGRCRVRDVKRVQDVGLYAPHTMHGDIVVNRVVASSYTRAMHPYLAHALLWPARVLVRIGISEEPLGSLLYHGAPPVFRWLQTSGILPYARAVL